MSSGTAPAPVPVTAPPRSIGAGLRATVAGLVAVVAVAARLWWGHWPILLSIALLGAAGRMAAIWAATSLSGVNNTLGVAVLVLAPLCSIASIVMLLHALRGALPHLSSAAAVDAPADPGTRRERRLLDVLAGALVPFLAVYASYGLLAEDTYRYANSLLGKEFVENADRWFDAGAGADVDRFVFATGWLAVGIVLGAMVLRWGIAKVEGPRRSTALSFAGAYVEVFWMTTLAAHLVTYKDQVWDWVDSRRAIDLVTGWWLDVLDVLGPVARPVDAAVDAVAGVLASLDDLVVIPLAWLTVGAIVFGHRLVPPPAARPARRWAPLDRLPVVVRRTGGDLVGGVVGDVRGRFLGLVGGLRQLAVAGLGPMLVFALAFLASTRLEDGLAVLVRRAVGPQPIDTWLAFSPHVDTVIRAIGLTVTLCLVAAAVDRVLAASTAPAAVGAEPASGAERAEAGTQRPAPGTEQAAADVTPA